MADEKRAHAKPAPPKKPGKSRARNGGALVNTEKSRGRDFGSAPPIKRHEVDVRIREAYNSRGFYPVRWSHHPAEVRDALRRHGIRPGLKACHRNSYQFFDRAEEFRDRLEYREGWVAGPGGHLFEHAWLVLDGSVLDLTLNSNDCRYLESYTVDLKTLAVAILERGYSFSFIWPDRMVEMRDRIASAAARESGTLESEAK